MLAVVNRRRRRATPNVIATPVIPVGPVRTGRAARRRRRRQRRRARIIQARQNRGQLVPRPSVPQGLIPGDKVLTAWIMSLNDPFTHKPMPLGLGTMYPTSIATLYIRGSIASNADGSFQIWFTPGYAGNTASAANGGFLMGDSAGQSVTPVFTAAALNPVDQTAFQGDFDQFRVLSAGIRVIHGGAFTGSIGTVASCLYPQDVNGNIPIGTALTPITTVVAAALPLTDWSRTIDPLLVTWRPVELVQLGNFLSTKAGAVSVGNVGFPPALMVSSYGGASANVFFEAIAHVEGYTVTKGILGGLGNSTDGTTGLSTPLETAWRAMSSFLEPVSQSVIEWAKEGLHTAAESALLGAGRAGVRAFQARMGTMAYPIGALEYKSNF